MTARLSDLTPEQREALAAFAREHGPTWRQRLADGWLVAAFPGPLQQIRNQRGPTWLRALPSSEIEDSRAEA